jgi:hypothetical protein
MLSEICMEFIVSESSLCGEFIILIEMLRGFDFEGKKNKY